MLTFTGLAINVKAWFIILKNGADNDRITIIALLLISIMITLSLVFISSKLRRKDFFLSFPTVIFLLFKLFIISYLLVCCAINLHTEMMYYLINISLNYIVPLGLSNELLALGMNGPDRGWVNQTGADFNRNNPNPTPTVPEGDGPYRRNNQGEWVINDPDGVVIKTKGFFIRGYNYGPSPFYKSAYALLSEKRIGSEIPTGLVGPQKVFVETARVYHFAHVEGRGTFDKDRHSYNTEPFRRWFKNFDGNTD